MSNETITQRLDFVTQLHYGTTDAEPAIRPPQPDVIEQQDGTHTEADFVRDLGKVTQRQSKPS